MPTLVTKHVSPKLLQRGVDQTDYVRIAKARAVEAAFIGHYVDLASAGAP